MGSTFENSSEIIPDDDLGLATPASAIWVGGAGNVRVLMVGGQTATLINASSGSYIGIGVIRVFKTGTTATDLLAFW